MNKSVVITGATGFIGNRLTHFLDERGYEVHAFVRKEKQSLPGFQHRVLLNDRSSLCHLFDEIQPRFVFHLASMAIPGRNLNEFDSQYWDTVSPAIQVALAIPESVELALFFGSCEEYGKGNAPFKEDQLPVCFSPYGWGKIASLEAIRLIAKQKDLPWCWLRPFLTFGPGQNNPSQLLYSLISGCLKNENIPLTPGEQTRDLIYINDLCCMLEMILNKPDAARHEIINLGSGIPRSVQSIARTVVKLLGQGQLNFGAIEYRIDEAMSFYASTEKYKNLFGAYQITDFEDSLKETILYIKGQLAHN